MSKVIALMSMSLDGFVADANDGVAELFDRYFSGDVDVPGLAAEHLEGVVAEIGAMLTGRRTFDVAGGWDGRWLGRPAPVGRARVRPHPRGARGLATARLDGPPNAALLDEIHVDMPRYRSVPVCVCSTTSRAPDRPR